jgi:hypothetical protein
MTDDDHLRTVLLRLNPEARDQLRRLLVRDQTNGSGLTDWPTLPGRARL